MATESSKYTKMHERRGLDLVEEWLHVESTARPQRRNGLHRNSAYQKSQPVYKNQIPKNMNEFRRNLDTLFDENKDETQSLILGRLILESTSLAQHGFLLGRVARGENIITALDESWHVLQGFKDHVRTNRVSLPTVNKLSEPIEDAISEYTGKPYGNIVHTYIGMVAFSASVAVQLRDAGTGEFILPSPGLPANILDRWNYDPPLVPKNQLA